MTMIQPFHATQFQADAALYFLPQGHYLLRWREQPGVSGSKFVTVDDVPGFRMMQPHTSIIQTQADRWTTTTGLSFHSP